jgi:shikimate kinase
MGGVLIIAPRLGVLAMGGVLIIAPRSEVLVMKKGLIVVLHLKVLVIINLHNTEEMIDALMAEEDPLIQTIEDLNSQDTILVLLQLRHSRKFFIEADYQKMH